MIRILLATHSPIMAKGLQALIEAEIDLETVGRANSGYQVLQQCQQLSPNVLVLDTGLPGPSIYSLVIELNSRFLKTNPLLIAPHIDGIDIRRLVSSGLSGCILQVEPNRMVISAIYTIGLGGVCFSKAVVDKILYEPSSNGAVKTANHDLTCRELEVLQLVAEGMSNKVIARSLDIKKCTVEFHMNNIFQKLHINSRVQAALWAKEHNLCSAKR